MSATFGDIRSLLHGEPDQQAWETLCQALEQYRGEEPLEEVVLPYCARALKGWPEHIERQAPLHWVEAMLLGEEVAMLSLCTHMNLYDHGIGDEGVAALAASPHLTQLQHLDLSDTNIYEEGALALALSPHLARLQHLNLGYNGIGDEGARALAASPHLAQLKHLELYDNDIGDEGAAALAASPHLAQLQHLDLSGNDIGDEGARALAASPYLPEHIRAHWRRA